MIVVASTFTFLNGLSTIFVTTRTNIPGIFDNILYTFNYQVFYFSKSANLLIGFSLIVLSYYLTKKSRVAWYLAVALTLSQLLLLATRSIYYAQFATTIFTLIALIQTKKEFNLSISNSSLKEGLFKAISFILISTTYGIIGFYFIDRKDFGINFSLHESIISAIKQMYWFGNKELSTKTLYAKWFLDSLDILGIFSIIYFLFYTFNYLHF